MLHLLPGWLVWTGAITGLGALFDCRHLHAAGWPKQRMLSLPDDYFSVFITSLFDYCRSCAFMNCTRLLYRGRITAGLYSTGKYTARIFLPFKFSWVNL
jgi:hypothetical protein